MTITFIVAQIFETASKIIAEAHMITTWTRCRTHVPLTSKHLSTILGPPSSSHLIRHIDYLAVIDVASIISSQTGLSSIEVAFTVNDTDSQYLCDPAFESDVILSIGDDATVPLQNEGPGGWLKELYLNAKPISYNTGAPCSIKNKLACDVNVLSISFTKSTVDKHETSSAKLYLEMVAYVSTEEAAAQVIAGSRLERNEILDKSKISSLICM